MQAVSFHPLPGFCSDLHHFCSFFAHLHLLLSFPFMVCLLKSRGGRWMLWEHEILCLMELASSPVCICRRAFTSFYSSEVLQHRKVLWFSKHRFFSFPTSTNHREVLSLLSHFVPFPFRPSSRSAFLLTRWLVYHWDGWGIKDATLLVFFPSFAPFLLLFA